MTLLGHIEKLLGSQLSRLGKRCLTLSRQLDKKSRQPTLREQNVQRWHKHRGDATLRVEYLLDADSIVFDLGGYEGDWVSDIFVKYCCTVHVFEPVLEFADKIEARFKPNRKIIVHKFGLSDHDQLAQIHLDQDKSSIYIKGNQIREAKLVNAQQFMQAEGIVRIDLMKINIEGGEYDLLDHLIDTGLVKQIVNIQVQFHDHVPDAERRMQKIQAALQKTHTLTYQYPFVWENWKRVE